MKTEHSARAFSLIELLVVMAVVGILASVVTSVLHGVRDRTDTVVCATNLRQLGIATLLFAKENNDEIPYANYYMEVNTRWYTKLVPYLDVMLAEGDELPSDPYRCPSINYPTYNGNRTHYGKNYWINSDSYVDQNPRRTGYHLSQIDEPGKYYYLADSMVREDGFANREIGHSSASGPDAKLGIEGRHRGRANILFLDMHVESIPVKDIPDLSFGVPPWCPRS